MAAAANHSHRAGKLKQQNKKNKRGNASKRSKTKLQGGKVQGPASGRKGLKSNDTHGKAKFTRMNAAKQKREAARKNVWNARRGIGAAAAAGVSAETGVAATLSRALANAPPRVVGIISLSELEGPLEERVRGSLMGGADKVLTSTSIGTLPSSVTAAYNMHAKGGQPHITLLTNSTSFRSQYSFKNYGEEDASVQGALDLCRVCDLVLFLIDGSTAVTISGTAAQGGVMGSDAHSLAATSVKTSNTTAHLDHLISERGDRILTAIKSQGLPTPLTVIVHKDEHGSAGGSPMDNLFAEDSMKNVMNQDINDDSDDEDMEEEEDMIASLPGQSMATNRSVKSIRRSYMRRRTELKRYVSRLTATEFGEASKVVEIDVQDGGDVGGAGIVKMDDESVITAAASVAATNVTSAAALVKSQNSIPALIRMLCTMSASGTSWVADASRPYLITDGTINSVDIKANVPPVQYDEATQELKLTGYIRGNAPWNCNQLVHVPHLGTHAVKNVRLAGVSTTDDAKEMLPPIAAAGRKSRKTNKNVEMEDTADAKHGNDEGMLLAEPDPEERESLEMFASPDALEGEQNLIGFDEDADDRFDEDLDAIQEEGDGEKKAVKFQPGTSRPAGWSDYQSAWLDALDSNNNEEEEDRGELAFALNKTKVKGDADKDMDDEDAEVNAEEKRALLAARKKDREDDLQFPDEADHEEETSARDRYARYRALKSFRKSYWDPKENLPDTYGAVYHFSSFKATQRDVIGDVKDLNEVVTRQGWGPNVGEAKDDDIQMEEDSEDEEEEAMARACVPPGAYVTITLEGVAASAYANLSTDTVVSAVSLLPHENKVSVLHMGLSSASKPEYDSEVPIKSKDVLTFRCGWRTWQSRPVFSQLNLNSDKHKFERYMPNGNGGSTFFAGSVFGPVTYAPCPVLMFRDAESVADGGKREFLAHGSMLGADADRIVLKRIILTGFPTRVHKRHATVKYMFYNPEDVKWFMPAEITTKHGLQGNIVQSIGDHGVMKCLFNAPIKQHDTVCLPLYKRVFPKFAPVGNEEDEEDEEEGMGNGGKHFRIL